MIREPLELTLYKYGGDVDPAVALSLVLGVVAMSRWVEWKATQPEKPAEERPAEVKAA